MLGFPTVTTTTARRVVDGNGSTLDFPTNFVFLDEDTLLVTLVDSSGVETVQTITTNYTVSGGNGNTGTVSMLVAPGSTDTLVVQRVEPFVQDTDLLTADPFNAVTVENQFDKLCMQIQQLLDNLSRAILVDITEPVGSANYTMPAPAAGEILIGKSDESGWENADPTTVIEVADNTLTIPVVVSKGGTGNSDVPSMLKENYVIATGSAGAFVVATSPAASALSAGQSVRWKANHSPTSQPTLALDGLAAVNIVDAHGQLLPNGGLISGGIYETTYDGTNWGLTGLSRPQVVRLSNVEIFTATGTWTKPTDFSHAEVEVVGPGGGSGGCATTGSIEDVGAGGGGGGEYGYGFFTDSELGATVAVTVPAGGAAGSAGDNDGSDGAGATSFGTSVTAVQGSGGEGMPSGTFEFVADGGIGGTGGTGGDYHIAGEAGMPGFTSRDSASGTDASRLGQIGKGGSAGKGFGSGGQRQSQGAGVAGSLYGGGAGGGFLFSNKSSVAGAAGARGVCIVKEYTFVDV